MVVRFTDLASASLFASRKNSEGYFAEILHFNAAHLYGPLPTMSYAVLVSELAAEEGDEVPDHEVSIPRLLHIIGVVLCMFSVITLSVALAFFAWVIFWSALAKPVESFVSIVVLAVVIYLARLLIVLYAYGLVKMIPVLRDANKFHHKLIQIFIITIMIFIIFTTPIG
mgnify:CR=1 FL=1